MPPETSNGASADEAAEVRRWVRAARDGDQDAYGALVKMYYPRVHGLLLGMVRNTADADDLSQQVWVKVWRKLHTFKGEADFYTWVYRVATFAGLDFIRKRKRQREVDWPQTPDWPTAAQAGASGSVRSRPDETTVTHEVWQAFEAALATLSPEHRAALILREVEGLAYDEMARIMRCRRGTVMSRLFYARQRMQTLMKDWQ